MGCSKGTAIAVTYLALIESPRMCLWEEVSCTVYLYMYMSKLGWDKILRSLAAKRKTEIVKSKVEYVIEDEMKCFIDHCWLCCNFSE